MDYETEESREFLRKEYIKKYWDDKKSLREIAKEGGTNLTYVYCTFQKLGIKTRTTHEAWKLRWKKEKLRLKNLKPKSLYTRS